MADVSMLRAEQTHITEALDALHEWYQAVVDEADQPLVDTDPPPTLRDGEEVPAGYFERLEEFLARLPPAKEPEGPDPELWPDG
jgi:hypothetical protein